jgi:hypothetical protein
VADQPDAVEGHTLRLQLELQLDRQPISGCLRTQAGVEERFEGWLGFADALRRLHDPPATEPGDDRAPGATFVPPV